MSNFVKMKIVEKMKSTANLKVGAKVQHGSIEGVAFGDLSVYK